MPDQHIYRGPVIDIELYRWALQISITLTEGVLLIYLQFGV